MPKVSVIIPVFNAEKHIGRALSSVCQQSFSDYEIIVVNDGSTDNSEAEILKFSEEITYVKQSNLGRGAARNAGLKLAKGEYIAFLDADDEWLETKLALQVAYLDKHPSAGLVYTDAAFVDQNGKTIGSRLGNYIAYQGDVFEPLVRNCFFTTSTVMVRRACFTNVGYFNTKLPRAQDYDLWLRMSLFYEFAFLPQRLTNYLRVTCLQLENRRLTYQCCLRILKKLKRKFPKRINQVKESLALSFRDYYLALAKTYIEEFDFTLAAFHLKKALVYCPLPKQEETLAIASYLAGKYKAAQRIIRKQLKENPFNAKMHFYQACCYFKEEKWQKARAGYWLAIKCMPYNPYFPEALNNMSLAYVAQNNFTEASRMLAITLNQKPDYQDAALNLKLCKKQVSDLSRYHFTSKIFGSIDRQ